MWDYASLFEQEDQYGNPRRGPWKWTKWADPFKNGVKKFEQVSCEGEDTFDIETWLPVVGSWFWTSFIPSPVELTRKTVTGGYKCGFYLGVRFKSPLDIIWRDGSGSRFLARVVRPTATAFYYMWMAQTYYAALSTWQSLIYRGYSCEGQNDSVITADGAANITIEGPGNGAMPFGLSIFDPNLWHTGFGSVIEVPGAGNTTCRAYITVTSLGVTLSNLRMRLILDNGSIQIVADSQVASLAPNEQVTYALEGNLASTGPSHWTILMDWTGMTKQFPLSRVELRLSRAFEKYSPGELPSTCAVWTPGSPEKNQFL